MRHALKFAFLALTFLAAGGAAFAQYAIDGSVALRLLSGERQLQQWADEVENAAPPDALAEAWDALEVLLRAERDEAALRLSPRLKPLLAKEGASTERGSQQENFITMLCKLPAERAKLCVAFFEMHDTALVPKYSGESPDFFLQKLGWSHEQIIDWLNARYLAALAASAPQLDEMEMRFINESDCARLLRPFSRAAAGWQ